MNRLFLTCVLAALFGFSPAVVADGAGERIRAKENARNFCAFDRKAPTAEQQKCVDAQMEATSNVLAMRNIGVDRDRMEGCLISNMLEKKNARGKKRQVFDMVKVEQCLKP